MMNVKEEIFLESGYYNECNLFWLFEEANFSKMFQSFPIDEEREERERAARCVGVPWQFVEPTAFKYPRVKRKKAYSFSQCVSRADYEGGTPFFSNSNTAFDKEELEMMKRSETGAIPGVKMNGMKDMSRLEVAKASRDNFRLSVEAIEDEEVPKKKKITMISPDPDEGFLSPREENEDDTLASFIESQSEQEDKKAIEREHQKNATLLRSAIVDIAHMRNHDPNEVKHVLARPSEYGFVNNQPVVTSRPSKGRRRFLEIMDVVGAQLEIPPTFAPPTPQMRQSLDGSLGTTRMRQYMQKTNLPIPSFLNRSDSIPIPPRKVSRSSLSK